MVQSVGRTGVAEYITDVGDGRIAPVPADGGVARAFLERLPVSPVDRERIAHRNAERLLRV